MEELNLNQKLITVQNKLKAPKSQYNSFGKYHYRNAEDILEAVKPILLEVGATITITDDIQVIADRIYVASTAIFTDCKSGEFLSTTAYAREPATKKGMDDSQITGCTSSYARKYALNGLLLIDDTKDSDGLPPANDDKPTPAKPKKPFKPVEPVKPQTTEPTEPVDRQLSADEQVKLQAWLIKQKKEAIEFAFNSLGIDDTYSLTFKSYLELCKLIANFKKEGTDEQA